MMSNEWERLVDEVINRNTVANTTGIDMQNTHTTTAPLSVDDLLRAQNMLYQNWKPSIKGIVFAINSTVNGEYKAKEIRINQETLEGVPNARNALHEMLDTVLDELFEGSTLIWKR
jgi:hypothetical protein